MDFESVKQKLADAFNATQNLELQPTKHNVDMLSAILRNLDEAFGMIDEAETKASEKAEEKKEEA